MQKVLSDLGLTENEAKVYLAFLDRPDKTAAEISRRINMDKSSTYNAVRSLSKKNMLVSSPGRSGLTYRAANPDNLRQIYQEQKIALLNREPLLAGLIKDLKARNSDKQIGTYIKVEYGVKAWQERMEEALSSKEKLIREKVRGSHRYLGDYPNHIEFVKRYAARRARRGIKILQLEHKRPVIDAPFYEVMSQHKKYLKEVRILPKDFKDYDYGSLRIWDDTMNLVIFDENNEFTVITIKDKYIATLMKSFYDFVWSKSKPYLP